MARGRRNKINFLLDALKEIYAYRELLFTLSTRSIKVHYKQTFFGIAWAIFTPLSTMLIFTFINKAKIINVDTGSIPYPIFAYCGLLPWMFFVGSLNSATTSLVDYGHFIKKIYFPREILPVSAILSKLIDFFIASAVLIGLMGFYHVKLHIAIVTVPIILLIQLILTAGLSFFLSMGHLFYRDVGYIVQGVMPLLMFITSVIYPIKVKSPQLQGLLTAVNPMIPIIDSYRDAILLGKWPNPANIAIPICLCFSLLIIGLMWFHKVEHLFAENI